MAAWKRQIVNPPSKSTAMTPSQETYFRELGSQGSEILNSPNPTHPFLTMSTSLPETADCACRRPVMCLDSRGSQFQFVVPNLTRRAQLEPGTSYECPMTGHLCISSPYLFILINWATC